MKAYATVEYPSRSTSPGRAFYYAIVAQVIVVKPSRLMASMQPYYKRLKFSSRNFSFLTAASVASHTLNTAFENKL